MLAINDARLSVPGDRDVQLAAAYCANELLCTTQTERHLDKTLARFTYDMGRCQRLITLNNATSITPDSPARSPSRSVSIHGSKFDANRYG